MSEKLRLDASGFLWVMAGKAFRRLFFPLYPTKWANLSGTGMRCILPAVSLEAAVSLKEEA